MAAIAPHEAQILANIFGDIQRIQKLSALDILEHLDSSTSSLNVGERGELFAMVYPQIVTRCNSKCESDVRAKLAIRIGDLKRDAGEVGSKGARHWYIKACQLLKSTPRNPDFARCLLGLGACCEMTNELQRAIEFYAVGIVAADACTGGLGTSGIRSRLRLRRGTVLTKTREFEEARKSLDNALELAFEGNDEDAVDFSLQKFVIHAIRQGDFDRAAKTFSQLKARSPHGLDLRDIQKTILEIDLEVSSGEAARARRHIATTRTKIVRTGYQHQLEALNKLEALLEEEIRRSG